MKITELTGAFQGATQMTNTTHRLQLLDSLIAEFEGEKS